MKLVIKITVATLSLFERVIIPRISLDWFKSTVTLLTNRLKIIVAAFGDDNLDNNEQLEQIAKETLLTKEFQELQLMLFTKLVEKANNEAIAKLIIGTEQLRSELFIALGDDVKPDSLQLETALKSFVKSENFDELAIMFSKLLVEKYSKNEIVNNFIIAGIEELVNSDDN
jgi:hypothetical protein